MTDTSMMGSASITGAEPEAPLRQFILKIASRCNLNCSYCYMYNLADRSYRTYPEKFMSPAVIGATLDRIVEYVPNNRLDEVSIILHGGEPLLLSYRGFADVVRLIRQRLGPDVYMTVQTNGTLLNPSWLKILIEHRVHIGISMDATRESHDRFRVDHRGRGTYQETLAGLEIAQSELSDLFTGVLCVIDPMTDPVEAYRHLRGIGVSWMDFLLPDACHDTPQVGYGTEPLYGQWLSRLYDAWLREDDPEVRIRTFESLIRSLLGYRGMTDAFGGNPLGYVVVETDGAFGGLDSLRAVQEGLADTGMNVFQHSLVEVLGSPIVREMRKGRSGIADTCSACPFSLPCGGGYLPHRFSRAKGFQNPSAYCWDLFYLCQHIEASLAPTEIERIAVCTAP